MKVQVKVKDLVNNQEIIHIKEINENSDNIERLKQHFKLDFVVKDHVFSNMGHTLTYNFEEDFWYIKLPDMTIVSDSGVKDIGALLLKKENDNVGKLRNEYESLYNKHSRFEYLGKDELERFSYLDNIRNTKFVENYSEKYEEIKSELIRDNKLKAETEYDSYINWFTENGWVIV